MKTIGLTQGFEAIIDDEDYDRVSQFKWHVEKRKSNKHYAAGDVGEWKKKSTILLHRFILNAPKDLEVDHINGNALDCRKENLRFASHHENMMNRQKHRNNTSGCKGVYWDKSHNKWRSQITFNNKKIHLGYFQDLQSAKSTYLSASNRYFGQFSNY